MDIKKASIEQIDQLLGDIEHIIAEIKKENKQEIRELQGESINIRVRFIRDYFENLKGE